MTPREVELLNELRQSREENHRLAGKLGEAQREVKLLREKVDALLRKLFGASSEKIDPAQLLLLLQGFSDPGKAPEPVAAEAPRRSTGPSPPAERGPRLPEHLPVVEEVLEPEPVQACRDAWRCIGQEVTEQLDYEPARFLKRRLIRPKYVSRANPYAAPIIAPLPTLQDRCLASPRLLAAIVTSKFVDHLPLYRQEEIFTTRHGIRLPRQTMSQWMGLAADWLEPIYKRIRTGVLGGGYVQIDETPIEYLSAGHGETKLGYFWTCARPQGDCFFQWETSRAARCIGNLIPAGWKGDVQTDGYAAYGAFTREHNGRAGAEAIRLAGCWAHARRALLEGWESAPGVVGWLLRQIAALFEVEDHLQSTGVGPKLRQVTRAAHSAMIVRRIQSVLLGVQGRYLPQSALGKGLRYVLALWPQLTRFLEDGRLELSNNPVENAIRPTAVGKKNWLFIGAAHTGQRSAILYTVVESCRRRGLDPMAYLSDVLTRLPSTLDRDLDTLTPEGWAKAQRQPPDLRAAS
jgi:transposase